MLKGMRITATLLLTTMILPAVQAEGFNINTGMWEMTYETKVTGGPPQLGAMMQEAPRVERECVQDNNYDLSPDDMTKDCEFKPTRHNANKLTYELLCRGEGGAAKGRGEVNFSGNSISGWSEMTIDNGPMGAMKVRDTFRGKRVGACE